MTGTKNLDALLPKVDFELEDSEALVLRIDGAGTICARGDEITQNGLEILARLEQEMDRIKSVHSEYRKAIQERAKRVRHLVKEKGKTRYYGVPVEEGRREVEFQETDRETVRFKELLQDTLSLGKKEFAAWLEENATSDYRSLSTSTKLKLK